MNTSLRHRRFPQGQCDANVILTHFRWPSRETNRLFRPFPTEILAEFGQRKRVWFCHPTVTIPSFTRVGTDGGTDTRHGQPHGHEARAADMVWMKVMVSAGRWCLKTRTFLSIGLQPRKKEPVDRNREECVQHSHTSSCQRHPAEVCVCGGGGGVWGWRVWPGLHTIHHLRSFLRKRHHSSKQRCTSRRILYTATEKLHCQWNYIVLVLIIHHR